MHNLTQSLKIIALAVVLSFGVSYVFAWTAPTLPPPDGNSTAPLNTSAVNQTKDGTLTLKRNDGVQGIETYGNALFATLGGRVGIGTAVPAGIFHVKGAAPNAFIESTNTSGPDLFFTGSGSFDGKDYVLYSSGSGNTVGAGKFVIHDESTGGAARLVIDSAGDVGIGVTAPLYDPQAKLDVVGDLRIGGQKICYYSCYVSGSQVLCDKKRFDTGATVQSGVYMGFTSSITPNVGEGQLVACSY